MTLPAATNQSRLNRNYKENILFLHPSDINDNILKIKFITDGNIDEKELKDYYFTKKNMKAINSFSDKLKLQNIVYLDDKIFEI